MNTKTKLSVSILVVFITLFGLLGVATPAAAMTCNSATLTGDITSGTPPFDAHFEYGLSQGLGTSTPTQYFNSLAHVEQLITGLTENTTYYYRLVASNNYGTSNFNIRNFTTPPCQSTANPTVTLTANPSSIQSGQSSILNWSAQNATSCSGSWSSWGGSVGLNGPQTVYPTVTTTYTITCYGATGTTPATSSAMVTVQPAQQTCQDPAATNYGGPLPCHYPIQTCQDPAATNYGGPLPCHYPIQTCQDPAATNYGGTLPCRYQIQTCQDPAAINYGGTLPCRYQTQTYTVIGSAGNGGSITPGSQQVSAGQTATLYVNANSGHTIGSVTGCNGYLNGSTFVTGAVNSNCTVYASFNPTQIQNNPTVDLYANPSNIQSGQGSTLTWNSQYANSCSSSWSGSSATSGSQMVYPNSTTTYNIVCYGNNGQSVNDYATVYVNQTQNSPTVDLYASPTNIQSGQSSSLNWSSQNTTSCSSSWSGSTSISGYQTVYPTFTTTYNVVCYGNNGQSVNDSVTVYVNGNNYTQVPVINLSVGQAYISSGNSTYVYWNPTNNPTYCNASNGANNWPGSKSIVGSNFYTGALYSTTTYTMTCGNNAGSTTEFVTVTVNNQQNNRPSVVVYADKASVLVNGTATVRWITTNAASCYATGGSAGWAGTKSIGPGVFYTGSLASTKTYSMTCTNSYGSASDSATVSVHGVNPNPTPTSLVLITSSVDRNQPIVPTIDNTRPRPGDEINYTVNYQNIGTGSIKNLTLRMDLPYEVDYMFSTPSNPTRSGNTLIFNLGTLKANGQGTVTVRVRVRDNIPAGTNLNFPATLSYVDPSGQPQSVSANVNAQVWSDPVIIPAPAPIEKDTNLFLGANVFGAGFLPTSLLGWLIFLILVLILVFLAKYIYSGQAPFRKKTTTTTIQQ